jgi:hypothetical protein
VNPAAADASGAVRREIEASHVRAIEALRQAKTLADLNEINPSCDTQDWQSIRAERRWDGKRRIHQRFRPGETPH